MAEEASAPPQSIEGENPAGAAASEDMEVEAGPAENSMVSEPNGAAKEEENGGAGLKRERGEGEDEEDDDEAGKRQKVERSVEEERLEKLEVKGSDEGTEASKDEEEDEEEGEQEGEEPTTVSVGPKVFTTSVEMFDYFYKLLHTWSPNLDINKYEHMALLDLLKKGHTESDKKIGAGVGAFQVRYHPTWKSRCFYVVRVDGTVDDFSFRKCVDHLMPLPENLKAPSASNGSKASGGHRKGGGGGGGRRGGRGGGKGGRGRGWRGKRT